jgi:hypothetical protein
MGRLFDYGKPNVKAVVRRGDVAGLVEAAGFEDVAPGPGGTRPS